MQLQESFYYWQFNEMKERLALYAPNSKPVYTMLRRKMLNHDAFARQDCDLSDFALYPDIMHCLQPLVILQELKERIAYTAIACERFLIPNQPISWHFVQLDNGQPELQPEVTLAKVQVRATGDWVNVLQFKLDGNIAECLLLEPTLEIRGGNLKFGQPFRLFANRIQQQITLAMDEQLLAYA